jgi:tetratricopeptide (TPR) repeat protein
MTYKKINHSTIIVVFLALWFAIGLIPPSMAGTSEKALRAAKGLSQQGDWAGAILEFEKALQEDPGNSVAQANMGVALSRVNRHKEALLAFQKALEMGYDNANFRYFRGLSLSSIFWRTRPGKLKPLSKKIRGWFMRITIWD